MRTQVAIIGAGPAGSLLALALHRQGIDTVVVERQTKEYVLSRIRAGILESTTVEVVRAVGVSARLDEIGARHEQVELAWAGSQVLPIRFTDLAGKPLVAYGQTMLQEDLYTAIEADGIPIVFGATDVALHGIDGDSPSLSFTAEGEDQRLSCDLIAACDGQYGVGRTAIPESVRTEYEKAYPFGWLGILSETAPLPHLVYANHEQGFALCSQRNERLSRYYVQCPLDDTVDDWSDDRFWTELLARIPATYAEGLETGPSIEKSIAPLRSYVLEPMQYGRLFLAGDAAHIVPPTGAKGLNLAISDVHYLSAAIAAHYSGDPAPLASYSDTALRRVWSSVRFSWWLTTLLHRFPSQTDFDQRAQEQDLAYLASSTAAQTSFAEQYVGLDL
ncbi:MAG: 4-hydroxybenzoate 3-monooxygenase [Actinomycetota bacterium]